MLENDVISDLVEEIEELEEEIIRLEDLVQDRDIHLLSRNKILDEGKKG